MNEKHIKRTAEAGEKLYNRQIDGEIVMLNLIKFKEIADYTNHPELDDGAEITGREAFQKYLVHFIPLLNRGGGMIFSGEGGELLVGPPNERWDWVLLYKQYALSYLIAIEDDPQYRSIAGHRVAALEDFRSLPLEENYTIFPAN